MKTKSPCPKRNRLVRLRDRNLAAAEVTELVSHVDQCPRCQAAMEQLTDGSSWANLAQQLRPESAAMTEAQPKEASWSRSTVRPIPQPSSRSGLTLLIGAGVGMVLGAAIAVPLLFWLLTRNADQGANQPIVGRPVVFKDNQVINGWGTVSDPDGDCVLSEDRGKLTIEVPQVYHDLHCTPLVTKLNAPRVWQDMQSDFDLQVCLLPFPLPEPGTSSSGKTSIQASGLLIWKDDSNFIRFERHAFAQQLKARVEQFQAGKSTLIKEMVITGSADQKLHLRMVRKASAFAFEFKTGDGEKAWTVLYNLETDLPTKLKVGVHAINTVKAVFAPRLESLEFAVRPMLIKGWGTAVDPDGDCQFVLNKGALTITVPKVPHDLFNGLNTKPKYAMVNAPRVMNDVKGDFSVQVRTSSFPSRLPKTNSHSRPPWVSAGLLVWSDENNFFRLDSAVGTGSPTVHLERVLGVKSSPSYNNWPVSGKNLDLKVARRDNEFTIAFKQGGSDSPWEGNMRFTAAMPLDLKVGVVVINMTNTDFAPQLQELQFGKVETKPIFGKVETNPIQFPLLPVANPLALSAKASAADHFQRADIPADVLATMGSGSGDAPRELVAVLGKAGDPQIVSLSLSRNGQFLAAGGLNAQTARIFDLADGKMKTIGDGQTRGHLVALSPDSTTLAIGGGSSLVQVFDTANNQLRQAIAADKNVLDLAFSPDGRLLAVADAGGKLMLWDLAAETALSLSGHVGQVNRCAFSPDGKYLASAGGSDNKREVIIWDVATAMKVAGPLPAGANSIFGLAWHPNGQTVAAAAYDGTIRQWDLKTKPKIQPLSKDTVQLHGLAWHPSGQFLASSTHTGGTVTIWDMRNQKAMPRRIQVFSPYDASRAASRYNNDLLFTPEGRHLIVANSNGTVSVLRLAEKGG